MKRHARCLLALTIVLTCNSPAFSAPELPLTLNQEASERFLVTLRVPGDLDAVRRHLHTLDPQGRFIRRSELIEKYFWATMSHNAAAALREHPAVDGVIADPVSPSVPPFTSAAQDPNAPAVVAAHYPAARTLQAAPLSADPEAGSGVRVAILSTGIDYTHALLGGDGTPAAYAEAFDNRLTIWDAFKNGVVVGGFDAASEGGGVDPNPLEHAVPDALREQFPIFPVGRGTLLGSIIHELAPGAELLAYKTWNIHVFGEDQLRAVGPGQEVLDRAFTRVLDPNGDGDRSDRADIALIDTFGGLAYYNPYEERDSSETTIIALVQALAANGVLVVTDTGVLFPELRFGISWIGAAPDSLTVGAMHEFEPDRFAAAPFSARGPVRGTNNLKPDLVSHAYNVTGARLGTGTGTTTETSNNVAAARIAAAAAILKSKRPELSSLDLKALLANTAKHDVLAYADSNAAAADVALIGLGREDIDAALAATALVRSESENQPSVNFGFHEFADVAQLMRSLVVQNLTDEDQIFTVDHSVRGDKPNNTAVKLEYPATVYVPAKRQVTIPVAVHVDPAKLQPWPMKKSGDYSGDAWTAVQVTGYLTLSSADAPDLSVAWMVTPRAKAMIRKEFSTLELISDPDLSWIKGSFAGFVTGITQEFTNTGTADLDLVALPLISERREIPENLLNSYGHLLRHVSGGVFEEPACSSTGRKFMIAATMHRPADAAAAHYLEDGDFLLFFRMVRNEAILNFGLDVAVNDAVLSALGDANHINYGFIMLDAQGQPQTYTTNLNIEFDPTNPTARYQQSSLPTYVAPHSRHAIAQFCVEDILHHDVTPDELDKNLGFVFSTDRDAFPKVNTPIIQFNPVKFGYVQSDFFSSINTGAKVSLGIASAEDRFSPTLALPPGATAKLTAIKDAACDGFGFGTPPPCARQFVLLDTNSDFSLLSEARTGDETALAFVREGQDFIVTENSKAGSLVGRLELDSSNFFGAGPQPDNPFNTFRVYLANSLPGDPFAVDQNGDITVNNTSAVDHEADSRLTLQVRTHMGMESTRAVDVNIHVTNVNDEAPDYLGGLEDMESVIGAPIALDVVSHFADIDGDALSFKVTGLPEGIAFNAGSGTVEGTLAASGEFDIAVTASDGVHDTSASFKLSVSQSVGPAPTPAPNPVRRSGGGVFSLWLLALLFPFACRSIRRR